MAGTETRSVADVAAADEQPADADDGAAADGGEGRREPAVSEELPEETALAYSVVIASFSSFNDALTRQRNWMSPETPYYIAPTTVRGVVYYRVFAGLLFSRSEAEALQDRLVDEGVKDAAGAWDIRPVHLAFRFGTYPERRAAESTVETLIGKGILAYLVSAAAPIGESAFHVYAGGYEKAEAAEPLREQIERVGLEAELVERVGILTP